MERSDDRCARVAQHVGKAPQHALPLSCPICHAAMRIIAFINDAGSVKKMLDQIGESTRPRRIAPARGPPLWQAAAAEQVRSDPAWDWSARSAPAIECDQRIAWQVRAGANTR